MGKTKAKKKRKKKASTKKLVYSHVTKLRCPRCGLLMHTVGTRENGRIKRWVCSAPVCRKHVETVGRSV